MALLQKIGSKLKTKSRYLLRDSAHSFGFYNKFYQSARGNRIMIYHGICKRNHTLLNPIFLTLNTFEQHLRFYKKHFNVISLDDYYQRKFNNNKFNICLTFDDGFANNHKYVLPLLEQYQLPATFFITSIRASGYDILWNDFLGIISKYGPQKIDYKGKYYFKGEHNKYISTQTRIRLVDALRNGGFKEKIEMMDLLYPLVPFKTKQVDEDYWLQMTATQIRELSASRYATIGAHSCYHNDLTKIAIADAEAELSLSKIYLENVTDKSVNSFAFPYGSYNQTLISAAKTAGYQQILAMDFNTPEDYNDEYLRERFTVNPFISTNNQMYSTIKKSYDY
jgi:peptidoglycan/xylan/chitin deacetylase (PgdA/CDA1 family)